MKTHQHLPIEKWSTGKENYLVQPSLQSKCVNKYRQNILKIG